jgi:hypothetical protein
MAHVDRTKLLNPLALALPRSIVELILPLPPGGLFFGIA